MVGNATINTVTPSTSTDLWAATQLDDGAAVFR
jgi:hypothetical protein